LFRATQIVASSGVARKISKRKQGGRSATAERARRVAGHRRTLGKITEKLAKRRKNQNNLLKIEKYGFSRALVTNLFLVFPKTKWRFEILPSLSIFMKSSNGAVVRSLITNLVLVFQKKKMADPKW
jgi:hypothetical protein